MTAVKGLLPHRLRIAASGLGSAVPIYSAFVCVGVGQPCEGRGERLKVSQDVRLKHPRPRDLLSVEMW